MKSSVSYQITKEITVIRKKMYATGTFDRKTDRAKTYIKVRDKGGLAVKLNSMAELPVRLVLMPKVEKNIWAGYKSL